MKQVVFTALLSVLLISSTVYLIMDQSKTELMNLPANSEDDTCLHLETKTYGPMRYEMVVVIASNLCQKNKKFTIVYKDFYGDTRQQITQCLAQNEDQDTSLGQRYSVLSLIEEDC